MAGCRRSRLAPLSGRYLSFAEREEIAILHAQRVRGARDRPSHRPFAVDDLAGAAPQRGDPQRRLEYRATTAQWHADRRARRPKVAKLAANDALRQYVQDRLAGAIAQPGRRSRCRARRCAGSAAGTAAAQDRRWATSWSPEQIANRLRVDFPDDESMRISHEAIYQALYVQGRGALRRELTACLRTGRALRVPRARTRGRGKKFVTPEIMISERPAEADGPGRARPLGRRPDPRAEQLGDRHPGRAHHPVHDAAAPAADGRPRRQPRVKNGPALAGHGAEAVRDAIAATITTLPEQLRRSLTWDQGAEMAQHAQLRIDTGLAIYFCDPHSPWQRGTNENTNGLLRQYFPKGTDLSQPQPPTTSPPSPPRSTAGPARPSAGRHPPRR